MRQSETPRSGCWITLRSPDGYVIGNTDEDSIEELQRAGLVVDEVAPAGRPTTAAMARGTMSAQSGIDGCGQATTMRYRRRSRRPSQWLLSLTSPLMGEMRESIARPVPVSASTYPTMHYIATATPEQAAELINLPFVRDVERHGPSKTEPIVLTHSDGNFGRSPHSPYGICGSPMHLYAPTCCPGLRRTTSQARTKVVDESGLSCLTTLN
jgi:hypothetical protein